MSEFVFTYDLDEVQDEILSGFDAAYVASFRFGELLCAIEAEIREEHGSSRGFFADVARLIEMERGIAFQSAKNVVSEAVRVFRSGGTVSKRARGGKVSKVERVARTIETMSAKELAVVERAITARKAALNKK